MLSPSMSIAVTIVTLRVFSSALTVALSPPPDELIAAPR
jgi:hypothetical protein